MDSFKEMVEYSERCRKEGLEVIYKFYPAENNEVRIERHTIKNKEALSKEIADSLISFLPY